MNLSHRILLPLLIAGISAAAWSGFLLGGGSLRSALVPATRTAAVQKRASAPPAEPNAWAVRAEVPSTSFAASTMPVSNGTVPAVFAKDEPAAPGASAPPPVVRRPRVVIEKAAPSYPLVMMELPPETLSTQPALAATMNQLREKFIADVGGPGQNPADPAYLARWVQIAPSIDDQLRAAIGWQAYNDLQAAAYFAQRSAP